LIYWPTNIAKHGHCACAVDLHQFCTHNPIQVALPVDAASVNAWPCAVGNNPIAWSQKPIADA
jgi:hypothetical protein